MDNSFESDLEKINDEALKYVGITNLDFRTHLSSKELDEVQKIIFSINTLLQVTFKDKTEVSDIENIKHLLELSPMCDDSKIEKLILRQNTTEELQKLLALPYSNPNTWQIAYDVKDKTYMLTTIPNYRLMEEYINIVLSCIKEDMSPLTKIKEVYDFIKLLDFDEGSSNRLPDIIKNRVTDNLGYSLLFSEILKRIGFKNYIGQIKRGKKIEYVTLVVVEDDIYGANGIYIFDPASDSIPKNLYSKEVFRKINYNYFARTFKEIKASCEKDKFFGSLSLIDTDSLEYFLRHLNIKDKMELEKDLGFSCQELYYRIRDTKEISSESLLKLYTDTVHEEDFFGINRDFRQMIVDNYHLREKELFDSNENLEFNKINIHDI